MKNIIAKSKTTELIIQVTYMDKHITRGQVLVGDTFNKVGNIDYWSTSTLDIKGNMKVLCKKNYLDFKKGVEYTFTKSNDNFIIQFENGEWVCDDENKVLEYFEILKMEEPKIVNSTSSILKVEVLKENTNSFTGKVLYSPGYYKIGEVLEWDYKTFNFDKDNSNIPKHYNNDNGSLYSFAEQHSLNSWEFDAIKRIVRSRKKGSFEEDIKKTIVVLELYLNEYKK
jgi:hypothetical protein